MVGGVVGDALVIDVLALVGIGVWSQSLTWVGALRLRATFRF